MRRWLVFFLPLSLMAQSASPSSNAEAIAAFRKGDLARARSLFEAAALRNPQDQTAQTYLRAIAIRQKQSPASSLETSLKTILIPRVNYQDVTVRAAVEYLSRQVSALSQGRQSLNVVWVVPGLDSHEPRITLALQDVPASDVLRYILDLAGFKAASDASAVRISRPPPSPAGT